MVLSASAFKVANATRSALLMGMTRPPPLRRGVGQYGEFYSAPSKGLPAHIATSEDRSWITTNSTNKVSHL